MKKHLLSLFDLQHRKLTISLISAAASMIIASQIIGTTDNIAGIAMLLGGMVCIFFAIFHPLRKSDYYGILADVCVGFILLTFLLLLILSSLHKTEYLSENVVMIFIGLFCLPGAIAGILGTILWGNKRK